MHFYETTICELGGMLSVSLDVEVECDLFEEEKATNEYPGSPGHIDITGVVVRRMVGDGYSINLDDRPDWRADADATALAWVRANDESVCEEIAEDIAGRDEAALESYYEHKREQRRETE